jgi:hypothetical protein
MFFRLGNMLPGMFYDHPILVGVAGSLAPPGDRQMALRL